MKIYSITLGCKVNYYETRAIISSLLKEGHKIGDINHFDIALINTCAVTHVASQKSRQMIHKLRKKNPKAIMVVMGCYVNEADYQEIKKMKVVDIMVNFNNYCLIPSLIKEFIKKRKPIIKLTSRNDLRKKIKYEELGISDFNENTRAYVKIADGCDNFCSYCIIPFNRGHFRSRDKDEILCEIKSLIKRGYKEIVLTGIDTSSYGKEFKNYRLVDLLNDILKNNPNLYRLRLSSIEISEINDKFLKLLKQYPNIVNHLHIPLQSGSDKVLKKMNRKYLTKEYLSKINKIRKIRKDIAITTDVIVGFPSESDIEFKKTCDFIKKVGFYELHVFPYSRRVGTLAAAYQDLSPQIKKERVKTLINLSNLLKKKYQKRFINKKLEVLVESDGFGLTSNYLKVKIPNAKANQIRKVKISSNILI